MITDGELRELAEMYAESQFTEEEWQQALPRARRKLEWIIQREGDYNGERLKPYYIAQLIAEKVHEERFTNYLNALNYLRKEDKKRTASTEAQGNPLCKHPHYSTAQTILQ